MILRSDWEVLKMSGNHPKPMPMGPGKRGPGGKFTPKEKAKNVKGTVKRLLRYISKNKLLLIALLGLVILTSVLTLLSPMLQADAIDAIAEKVTVGSINGSKLIQTLIFLGILTLVTVVFNAASGIISASLSQYTVKILRRDLFAKIETLPVKYFDTHAHGDLMSRLTNDIDNISNTLSQSVTAIFTNGISVIGSLAFMLYYSPLMTLITVLAVPAGILLAKGITVRTRKYFSKQQTSLGELNGHIEEMVTGQKTVAAFSREEIAVEQFDAINQHLREYSIKAQIFSGLLGPLMNVISNLSFVLVAISGGWMAWSGQITIGTIQAFIQYSKQFSRPINELANQYNTIQSAIAGAERVFDIMDQKPESDSGNILLNLPEITGKVDFENVNFGYNKNTLVLKNFSLNVKPGMKIALVGPTGAGKTTVVNLITRFYDINSGTITLDDINIEKIQKSSLRETIGIVLQDTVLFSGTIRDNICYGKLDASDEEIIAAAKTANAHSFISRMPDGYNTALSEQGANLSQGQRQLIAIARAVLADPKILILDEATSSIDTRTEMHIQQAMIALMSGRTSFIIAHRLSTIRDADAILVLKDGRIAEKGNHEELLKNKGPYWELYMTQFRRETEDSNIPN